MEKPVTGICHPPSDMLVVEPEYCPQAPQAVVDWYKLDEDTRYNSSLEDAEEMARKHLAAMGWVFVFGRKGVKRELRYTSPGGKCFHSLRTACKACIDEGAVSMTVGSNSVSRTVSVASGSVCEKIACYRKPIKFVHVSDNVKGDIGGHPKRKRKRGKVLAELKKIRKQSSGTQSKNLLGSGKIVRDAVICSSSKLKVRSLLCGLIDNNVLLPRTRVHYRGRNGCAPSKKGHITRDGIKCDCCYTLFSLTAFEAHAGSSNHRPAANILLEDGRSLQDCRRQGINNNSTTKLQENDEICSVCHYGGELVLCDQCPSSFHKSCIGLQDVPVGDWCCPSCACGVCGHGKFQEDNGNFMDDSFVTCKQCEHKFHIGCLKSKKMVNTDRWFCGRKCECIFLGLRKLLGKPIPVGVDNLTWTLLKSTYSESCNLADSPRIEASMENYRTLNAALSLMHEIFEPVKQPLTNTDLAEDVIFSRGSELKQSNFRGFYTVLLERNDEVICVATVRIYGEKVAEIPLVGTSFQHRRCGMCRILMDELEKQLMALGVERLILHAAPTVLKTWTTSFGFSKMTDFEKVQFMDYTFLDFEDTIMCQKLLMKKPAVEIVDQGLVDTAVTHGKFNFQCFDEVFNFKEASRDSNSDYSKKRKISAWESQSSDYSKFCKRRNISASDSRFPFHDTTGRYLMSAF
ncbi:increased DNA methylation 1-like [Alnus glutinosa]|uniref:increased DNA methylation 1-like n=1 Tax=Alnus glutinosa TaxID=3517 RepID=UPI002D79F5B6|nr:increased DNA methylation 1-like [Alnus glutinosa]